MKNPVLHGFRNLTRFAGRDTRGQFWSYAAVVLVIGFALMAVAMSFALGGFFAEMEQFAAAHPEATTVQSGPGSYSISVDAGHPDAPMPDMGRMFISLGLCVLVTIALLAAAVSRRLHDSGRSALWGLLPVPFLLFGIGFFPVMMNSMMTAEEPDLSLFFMLFGNNILYLVALVTLIVLLCQSTARGANRYGEEPSSRSEAAPQA